MRSSVIALRVIVILMVLVLAGGELRGQDAAVVAEDRATTGTTAVEAGEAPAEIGNPALEFLSRLEKRNAETKALKAEFSQVRTDRMFLTEFRTKGRFWYRAPNLFRASYENDEGADSDIWMRDSQIIQYTPGARQVDIVKQKTGSDAAVNQLLLGFGIKVSEITRLFDVSPEENAVPAGMTGIRFESKDPERSFGYNTIHVFFDSESMEPRRIVAEDEQQDVTIELTSVRLNPDIEDAIFQPKWPEGTEVLISEER